jgi:uncharacterized protein (TIGR03083 family)
VETNPAPWIEALRHSHDRLRTVAGPLGLGQLQRPSYAPAWSIAQVLSHLGSQAEVFSLLLDAGLTGQDPPGRDTFGPIWQAWDAKSAQAQAGEALRADQAVTERFESLDAGQREQLRLKVFGMDLDTAGLARMRLGEHAIHTWDIAVVLDPAATVAPDAVALLIDALGQLVTRTAKPGGADRRWHVSTTTPVRHFTLAAGQSVTLAAAGGGHEGLPEVGMPAEALVRLVYGRLDPAHTPPIETRRANLGELRQLFPGF